MEHQRQSSHKPFQHGQGVLSSEITNNKEDRRRTSWKTISIKEEVLSHFFFCLFVFAKRNIRGMWLVGEKGYDHHLYPKFKTGNSGINHVFMAEKLQQEPRTSTDDPNWSRKIIFHLW